MKPKIITRFKTTLSIIVLFFAFTCASQDTVIVYKNYDSYVKNKGDVFENMLGYSHVWSSMKIILVKNKVEGTISCQQIYGFLYRGKLFRTDTRTGQVAVLISKGKICYYENGPAYISMLRDKTESAAFSIGYFCYVSNTLDAPMVPFPDPSAAISDAKKMIKTFRNENPQHEELFRMLNGDYHLSTVRSAITMYEMQ